MKKRFALLIPLPLIVFLTACTSPPALPPTSTVVAQITPTKTAAATVTPTEAPTPTPEVFNPAPVEGVIADKAREDLATRLGMDLSSISVPETSSQEWPDACLGLAPEAGKTCEKSPVPGWRLVLNAAGHTHEYRATADGKLVSYGGPVGLAAPPACTIQGTSSIYSPEDGYCFVYPVRFHRTDERGPIAIFGPAYGPGPEPIYAALNLEITPLSQEQSLDAAVNAFITQLGNIPLPGTRQALSIDGEPALMLEVVPGMLGSRDVFMIHNGRLFHLTFWPAPPVRVETAADVEDLYQTVTKSWNFLP